MKLTPFQKENRFGLYNELGKEILPCLYHAVFKINEYLFGYRMGTRWGIIKSSGEIIFPAILKGHFETSAVSRDYELYLREHKPKESRNPFREKFNDAYLKEYTGWFIEDYDWVWSDRPYFIVTDNLDRIIIISQTGEIVSDGDFDNVESWADSEWYIVFKHQHANFWKASTQEFLLKHFIPDYSVEQTLTGINFFYYKPYILELSENDIVIIDKETGKTLDVWNG